MDINILKDSNFLNLFKVSLLLMCFINYITLANNININSIIDTVPHINAEAYILMDYNSNKVLAEHNADKRIHPASLTKIMTSYIVGLAIKEGKIHPNDIVTIGKDAWATGNSIFKGSSLMFLKPGDKVSIAQLRRGIVLQSGNDACVAIADYISGSQNEFVKLMNSYVDKLGLKNTHFQNVHGLDARGQYSSARDMALLSKALIHDVPEEYAIYREKEFTFNHIRQLNRNGLLWDTELNVDGIKTGHTISAGYNLIASATSNKMRLISAVLGEHTYKGREIESKKLLNWGFRSFESVNPLSAGTIIVSKPVWFGNKNKVNLGIINNIYLTIPKGRLKDLKTQYIFNKPELYAPLYKNQVVGNINFNLDGKTLAQYPIVVMDKVEKCGFFKRIIDYIKLQFYHLIRWFKK